VSFFLDVLGMWQSVEDVLMKERDGDRDWEKYGCLYRLF
jgi:hypothetical protein